MNIDLKRMSDAELKELKKLVTDEIGKRRNTKKYPLKEKGCYYIGLLNEEEADFVRHLLKYDDIISHLSDSVEIINGDGIVDKPLVVKFNEKNYEVPETYNGKYFRGKFEEFHHLEYLIYVGRRKGIL